MKKIVLGLVAIFGIISISNAAIGISWSAVYGAYSSTAPNTTDYGSPSADATALLHNSSAIWQLIYAGANNVADSVSLATGGVNGDYVSNDDVVWGQRTLSQSVGWANVISPEDSCEFDFWMVSANLANNLTYVDLSWNTAGFVYQRVYEGTPAMGSMYFQTALIPLDLNYTAMGGPVVFNLDDGNSGFQPDRQIPSVPEPATMSLVGLGALVMMIRRRMK